MDKDKMDVMDVAVDKITKEIYDKISDNIDVKFVISIEETLDKIKMKQERNELNLNDLKELLLIYKNIIIPAAMKQEADKLRSISLFVDCEK